MVGRVGPSSEGRRGGGASEEEEGVVGSASLFCFVLCFCGFRRGVQVGPWEQRDRLGRQIQLIFPTAEYSAKSIPTVLQISFAFMYLQKSLKNTYPTGWHLDFAILLTWQKERKDWHICQTCSHLALGNWREVINAKTLEIVSFHLCHTFLRLGNLPHLPNQLCKTVGNALIYMTNSNY